MIESIFFNPWVWIIATILFILLMLVIADFFFDFEGFVAIPGGILFVILGAVYFGFVLPPYDASFYQTYRVTGEVTTMERAINAEDGGGLSQSFIVGVEGVDLLITSDDQRFRTVDVGDDVNLVCTKGFNYFVEPWYDCSMGG